MSGLTGRLAVAGVFAAACLTPRLAAAFGVRPATVANIDLSGAPHGLAAAVPVVALDPADPGTVAVVWRTIDPLKAVAVAAGDWVCQLSTSGDGGVSFETRPLAWGTPRYSRCNAPYAAFSAKGALYVGATLTAPRPPAPQPDVAGAAASRPRIDGAAVIARSDGAGLGLGPTVEVLASDSPARFAPSPWIPSVAKATPWDGARGAVDLSTGTVYLSGAYPAPPGGAQYSQRFYAASTDGARSFGPIRPFSDPAWPERWDGDLATARGELALSYIAAATPNAEVACPCAVFAVSHDGGRTLTRSLVAPARALDLDTLVHFPEVAADPAHAGRFAVAIVGAGRASVSAYLSDDDGRSWRVLAAPLPADVVSVSRPAVAVSPLGRLALAWRGYHADGGYDIYLAAERDGRLGPAFKVSSATSHLSAALAKTYASRGDFHTTLALDDQAAHLAWADARDGIDQRVYYARVPLALLARP